MIIHFAASHPARNHWMFLAYKKKIKEKKRQTRGERWTNAHWNLNLNLALNAKTLPPKSLRPARVDRFASHSFLSLSLAYDLVRIFLYLARALWPLLMPPFVYQWCRAKWLMSLLAPSRNLYVSMHVSNLVTPTSSPLPVRDRYYVAMWHIPVHRPKFFYSVETVRIQRLRSICNGPCNLSRTSPAGFLSILIPINYNNVHYYNNAIASCVKEFYFVSRFEISYFIVPIKEIIIQTIYKKLVKVFERHLTIKMLFKCLNNFIRFIIINSILEILIMYDVAYENCLVQISFL